MYRWDPGTNQLIQPIFHVDWTNAFCTGHSFLADGRLLVTGGHDRNVLAAGNTPGYALGLNHVNTYNYSGDQFATRPSAVSSKAEPVPWVRAGFMERRRWYPTNTTLRNGDVLITAGETEPTLFANQKYPELWQNGTLVSLTGAPKTLPTYPWMFQAPNGQVFYAGPGNDLSYVNPYYVSPATQRKGTWTDVNVPVRSYGFRGQGTAAMFWPGRILVVGGSDGLTVTNTVETIDLTAGTNGSVAGADGNTYLRPVVAAAPLRYARHHINATLLPDGTVLVTGGSRVPASRDKDQGVLEAEIWTPTTGPNGPTGPGTWTTVAAMAEARMYHSTAALLPDGRVLSAGGEEVIDYAPRFVPNLNNHCTAELYSPAYLSRGPRPVISYAPALASYGQPFAFDTPDAATIDAVTWIRLSSVTHSFNMNQRFLRAAIRGRSATGVTTTAPGNASECPPGHYLVFALRNGVPWEAKIVAIDDNPCAATLSLSASIVQNNCSATAQVVAGGTNLGSSYHWFIDGTYNPAYDGQPSVDLTLTPCRPQATVVVEVIPACGGPTLTRSQSVNAGPMRENGRPCLCDIAVE